MSEPRPFLFLSLSGLELKYRPCRDRRGRFAACGAGGALSQDIRHLRGRAGKPTKPGPHDKETYKPPEPLHPEPAQTTPAPGSRAAERAAALAALERLRRPPTAEERAASAAQPKRPPKTPMIVRAVEIGETHGVDVVPLPKKHFREEVAARYEAHADRVVINEDHKAWADPAFIGRMNARGWLSSGGEDHLIHHEIGHALHARAVGFDAFRDNRGPVEPGILPKIRRDVSEYATADTHELVAEVYAGAKNGRKFPPEIMDYYRKLGGVQL